MRTGHLLRLLDAELIDAEDDIRDFEEVLRERISAREITNYVYRENTALLEWELHAIERIRSRIKLIDPKQFPDLSALRSEIESLVHDQVEHHEAPRAIESIVVRRLQKLLSYVERENGVLRP